MGRSCESGLFEHGASSAPSPIGCGNCSNCLGEFDSVDVTETARRCVQCVREVNGSFGKSMVADIVRGSKAARLLELGLDRLNSYDTVSDSISQVKEVIELLAAERLLQVSDGTYPVVGLGPRCFEADADDFEFTMKRMKAKGSDSRATGEGGARFGGHAFGSAGFSAGDDALFERLRALRKRIADTNGIPPYVVFSDRTLRDMCVRRPKDRLEFLQVNGVGETKLARYGETFMEEIAAFEQEV